MAADGIDKMILTPAHKTLFNLLRAGLWKRPLQMDLTVEEWHDVYDLSVAHTVSGICFAALSDSIVSSLPPDDLMAKWTAKAVSIERRNRKVNDTLGEIADDFRNAGLKPIILKGQGIGRLYPDPLLRECGDIDVYFPDLEVFRLAAQILGHGHIITHKNDGSVECNRNGVIVELHKKMFDMVSPSQSRTLKQVEAEYGFVDSVKHTILTPAPVLNLIMQSLHILRHALCFGIGLRQLCDYAVCFSAYSSDGKIADEVSEIMEQLHLSRWNEMLLSFLHEYLGLDSDIEKKDASPLFEIVMEGGNFGFYPSNGYNIRSWKNVVSNNRRLFHTVPRQSITTLISLATRQW